MAEATFDPLHVLAELHARQVRYVLVGDLAAMAHGSTLTADRVELCLADDDDDLARLGTILEILNAEQDDTTGDPRRVVFHTAAGRLECLDLSDAGGYQELDTRATDVDLGHGVIARVAAPEDIGVQKLASDDLVGAVRSNALGRSRPRAAAPVDENEFAAEELSWRRSPWRKVWKKFEDVDRYLTEVNEGTRPLGR
jgi:hypothetical protein